MSINTLASTAVFGSAQFDIPRNRELDLNALNIFFRVGTFLGGDTPFKGVRAPVDPVEIAPHLDLSREAAMDAYIDLFRCAVSSRLTDRPFGLGLSGGRDSRHILLEMHRQGVLPTLAFTVDLPGNPADLTAAVRVASHCRTPHLTVRPQYTVQSEMAKNHATAFSSLQHAWLRSAVETVSHRLPPVLWDGIGGDVLSAGLFLTERNVSLFEQGRLDELAEDLTLKGDVPLAIDPSLFSREAALQRVYSELRKHIKAANPVGSFYFWSRTRRDIGSSVFGIVGGDGREVITPFLDRKLWTLLAGLPARMLLSRTFHTDTIARAFPEAAKLPYAGGGRRFPLSHTMSQVGNFVQWIYSRRSFGSLLDVRKARLLALRTLAPARSSDILWLRPFSVYLSTV